MSPLFLFALFAAVGVAGFTLTSRGAGLGCLGLALLLFGASMAGTAGAEPWVAMSCMAIAATGYGAVRVPRRFAARRTRLALAAREQAHREAAARQRRDIPSTARPLGRAVYQGGIATMATGHVVDLIAAAPMLWLAPVDPGGGIGWIDDRLVDLYVVDGTPSVVVVLAGERGRDVEVELSATAPGGIGTARQLYAVLSDALPARPEARSTPAVVPRKAAACAGCGAPAPGGGPDCRYCGRPLG